MTDLELRAGQIHRGLGVVARWPNIALVIPSDAAHDATVDQMFHDLGPHPEARQIVTTVQTLLAAGQLRSVAMLVEATGGPLAMAFGPVEVLVDGVRVLDGSKGGVRQQLPPTAHRLTIRAAELDKAAEPVAPYDLRRGVAPGAGLTLVLIGVVEPALLDNQSPSPPGPANRQPAAAPTPGPPDEVAPAPPDRSPAPTPGPPDEPAPAPVGPSPQPAPAPALHGMGPSAGPTDGAMAQPSERAAPAVQPDPLLVPFHSVVLIGAEAPGDSRPLPRADGPPAGPTQADLDAGRVEVQGIVCTRQHFNNPEAARCMVCGLSLLHLSNDLVIGLRPTLGFIVFDDGATFGLDRSYVIGREPHRPKGSSAQLLVLSDNNETLSRTHAALDLDNWAVRLTDLESTNGTYVWDVSAERWNQLTPGVPVELRSGDTVALGRRTFVFESVGRN